MTGEIHATIVGNLGDDPEMRFTPSGTAVCKFPVANTARKRNDAGEYVDEEPTWVNVTCWRSLAENAVESLKRGTRVIVHGTMRNRPWEDKEGNKRYSLDMEAYALGVELTWNTVQVEKGAHTAKQGNRGDDEWASASKQRPAPQDGRQNGQQANRQRQHQQAGDKGRTANDQRATQSADEAPPW
jgi:single-strand DNA-binding protein